MSECRAITNLVGNGVATIVISRWEKELDKDILNENLRKPKSVVDLTEEEAENQTPAFTLHNRSPSTPSRSRIP
jgi:aerobic C4-dicarboxylate transport protein